MLQPSDCGVLENFGIASQIPVILDLQRTIDSRIWNGRAEVWSWDGAEGIPSHSAGTSLSDEYDPAEGGPQPELSVALESAWKILSNGARYQELFQFGSWNWHPIVETRMRYLCTELTAKLWQKRNQSQRILGSIRPHVVLFRNPNTLSIKVVAHTARRMGIRIVGTQHGESGIRRGPVTVQYQEYAFCDDFLVYGEGTVNFSDRYYPGKVNTIIVGSPQLDSCRKNQMGKEELCRRLGFSGNKKLVIVCFTDLYGNSRVSRNTMPSDCSSFRSLRRIVDVFPQHPDVQFIIKAHPGRRAPASPFYAYADHLKAQNVVVRSQVPLSKILTAADMFIVNCPSTALLQMSLYDSPIYIFEDWAQWDEEALDIIKTRCYVDDDIGHFCERLDADLRSGAAFQRVLTDRSLRHTYADPFEDGLSAERVKEAVMNIALQSSLLEEL